MSLLLLLTACEEIASRDHVSLTAVAGRVLNADGLPAATVSVDVVEWAIPCDDRRLPAEFDPTETTEEGSFALLFGVLLAPLGPGCVWFRIAETEDFEVRTRFTTGFPSDTTRVVLQLRP